MQRCIMLKYINQHLTGNQTVHLDPCALIFRKLDCLFHHDQRAGLYLTHLKYRPDDPVYRIVAEPAFIFRIKWHHG